jgi:hypothetical protein
VTIALTTLHAALGLAVIAASLFAVVARTPERIRRRISLMTAVVLFQTAIGDALYPRYLTSAKPVLQTLAAGSRSVADIFDVKEHLAFVVLVLTLGAFVLTRREPKPTTTVRVLVGSAHGASILVAALGLACASVRTP